MRASVHTKVSGLVAVRRQNVLTQTTVFVGYRISPKRPVFWVVATATDIFKTYSLYYNRLRVFFVHKLVHCDIIYWLKIIRLLIAIR